MGQGMDTWIRSDIPAGNDVGRREGRLFHLGEVVDRIAVQRDLAKRDQRVVVLGDSARRVEDVGMVRFGLAGVDDLGVDGPRRVVALGDGVVQVASEVVRVFAGDGDGFVLGEVLDSLVRLECEPDVFEGSILCSEQLDKTSSS